MEFYELLMHDRPIHEFRPELVLTRHLTDIPPQQLWPLEKAPAKPKPSGWKPSRRRKPTVGGRARGSGRGRGRGGGADVIGDVHIDPTGDTPLAEMAPAATTVESGESDPEDDETAAAADTAALDVPEENPSF